MSIENKTLDVANTADATTKIGDIKVIGNPDSWVLLCKASSLYQGWMKSTKAMEIVGVGCLVQSTTQQHNNVAEAITFVPNATIKVNKDGHYYLAKNEQ